VHVPAVVLASVLLNLPPLVLGLDGRDLVLLVLAFLVSTIILGTGRTNSMRERCIS
jgi:Ca2+/H+ antiporter